jgi:hypothetical protein
MRFSRIIGSLLLLTVVLASCGPDTSAPRNTEAEPQSTPVEQQHNPLPASEREFISIVETFKARYEQAPNEFQKSTLRRERSQAMAMILPDLSIADWIGDISSMHTTQDERGILAVKLRNSSISLQTVNNVLSDAFLSGTLIPHGSPLYEEIANLSVGTPVTFGGRFTLGQLDHVREESITEEGSMTDPEFIFTFTTVHSRALSQRSDNGDSKPSVTEPRTQPIETAPTAPIAAPAPDSEPALSTHVATPTSGVLCNGPVNVPQFGQLVFNDLPSERLRFTFDHDAWQPTIQPQPDGRKTLTMRSLKPGIQTYCHVRWEIVQ